MASLVKAPSLDNFRPVMRLEKTVHWNHLHPIHMIALTIVALTDGAMAGGNARAPYIKDTRDTYHIKTRERVSRS